MFVPGNNPAMMADAHIYGPDSIMLDLEDSVTMAEKDTARLLVYNALKSVDYGDTEMVVRINPLNTPYGKKDIEAVVKAGVHVIRMPKTETADEVREVEAEIERVEKEIGCLGRTKISWPDHRIHPWRGQRLRHRHSLQTNDGYRPRRRRL